MHALAIIDVQEFFNPDPKIIPAIIREINCWKRNNWPVILVEYAHCGSILQPIRNKLKNHDNKKTIVKYDDDGSFKISQYLHRIGCQDVRCVGVNTSCCVYKTVQGLCKKFKVEVVYDACANEDEFGFSMNHDEAIFKMKEHLNVRIVRNKMKKKMYDKLQKFFSNSHAA